MANNKIKLTGKAALWLVASAFFTVGVSAGTVGNGIVGGQGADVPDERPFELALEQRFFVFQEDPRAFARQ